MFTIGDKDVFFAFNSECIVHGTFRVRMQRSCRKLQTEVNNL